jgi:hypothetical protein
MVKPMDEMKYTQLTEVPGRWKAEIVESLLKSEGIDVVLIQDSISHSAYTTSFAPVQIYVPKEKIELARELLKAFDDNLMVEEDHEDEEEE